MSLAKFLLTGVIVATPPFAVGYVVGRQDAADRFEKNGVELREKKVPASTPGEEFCFEYREDLRPDIDLAHALYICKNAGLSPDDLGKRWNDE